MKIGIPTEIKNNENRVSLTPAGAYALTNAGHSVFLQSNAGLNSGFTDEDYKEAGAIILPDAKSVYQTVEMIMKVKEPLEEEYNLIQENQLVFTYFHFASNEKLTQAMIERKAVCLAYETVEVNNSFPLLLPMSEVAGRMAAQQGAKYLERRFGGKGILMGGVTGVKPANVLVIGGGIVGQNAALIAAGMQANVTILDISIPKMRHLNEIMPSNVRVLMSNKLTIEELLPTADVVIGAVLIPGAKAPKLVTREMLKLMQPRTVIVDVAIDQGGCFETSQPTTHDDPIFTIDEIVHYSVANMPGAVPFTSTTALSNATLPYAVKLANLGWEKACKEDDALYKGLNVVKGKVVYKAVAEAFDLPYEKLDL